jgi:signal transduction histidine kinase
MMSTTDALELVGVAAGTSAVVSTAGVRILRRLHRRPLRDSVVLVALTPVLTVVVSATIVVVTMFVSTTQFAVLIAAVVFAGLGGLITSVVLARTITRGSDELRDAASAVIRGERYVVPTSTPSAELSALSLELGRAHASLDQARAREQALEESRRELIAWVSHDLRTPLAGIKAMAEALEDDVVSTTPDRRLYYGRIRRESDRLAAMVDDLFELSRIHAGSLNLSRRSMGLADVVREAIATIGPVAAAKGVRLSGPSGLDRPIVDVDEYQLQRVVANLVGNAVRYTPHAGAVDVAADQDTQFAYLTVTDACGGIPDADLDRVFDVSFRGSAARTPTPDGGAGLGLAIARGIVEAHDGEINVVNVFGGCRFTVALPLSDGVALPLSDGVALPLSATRTSL